MGFSLSPSSSPSLSSPSSITISISLSTRKLQTFFVVNCKTVNTLSKRLRRLTRSSSSASLSLSGDTNLHTFGEVSDISACFVGSWELSPLWSLSDKLLQILLWPAFQSNSWWSLMKEIKFGRWKLLQPAREAPAAVVCTVTAAANLIIQWKPLKGTQLTDRFQRGRPWTRIHHK